MSALMEGTVEVKFGGSRIKRGVRSVGTFRFALPFCFSVAFYCLCSFLHFVFLVSIFVWPQAEPGTQCGRPMLFVCKYHGVRRRIMLEQYRIMCSIRLTFKKSYLLLFSHLAKYFVV